MVQADDCLWIANRQTGSISIVDLASGNVQNEIVVSERLDDLITIPDTRALIAVDSESHQLLVLERSLESNGVSGLRTLSTQPVAKYPVSLAVSPNGELLTCASKWSRRLTIIESKLLLSGNASQKIVDLPFVPLRQCFLDNRFVLIADAHGGELAIVNAVNGELRSRQKLIGHNIRGLSLSKAGSESADRVTEPGIIISHQILNVASSTTRSTISWGGVISNTLHAIPVRELFRSSSTQNAESIHGSLFPLGHEGQGTGDPSGIALGRHGQAYVALRGMSEVAMRPLRSRTLTRVPVGRGPTQLILDEDRDRLFVLSQFDDSISELNATSMSLVRTIRLGKNPPPDNIVRTGEELFFDSRLSLDGWFSCHSCHSDGHTTGQLNDNFGDESFGTPKQILSLLGTGHTKPWAWNGNLVDLHEQIRKSIEFTMAGPGKHSPEIGDREIKSLEAYLSSLPAAPGILSARDETGRPSVARGELVFKSHGCDGCHQPPIWSSALSFDVGLKDEAGNDHFNPPSLRGVSQRGPYFHDNRAARLIDVLIEHDHASAASLSESDIADLLDFLKSL